MLVHPLELVSSAPSVGASVALVASIVRRPAVVPLAPRVGVAVQVDADDDVALGTVPAAALVASVPPEAIGVGEATAVETQLQVPAEVLWL